jgi:hypothetical protein
MDVTTEDKKLPDFRPIILDIDKLCIYNITYIQDIYIYIQDIYIYIYIYTGYIYIYLFTQDIYIYTGYIYIYIYRIYI